MPDCKPSPMLMMVICLIAALTALPQTAYSNGAVWNPGSKPGTPGPMKNKELILLKEHVLFNDEPLSDDDKKVVAQFWIYNPTEREIRVTMGFPLQFGKEDPNYQSHSEYLNEFSRKFEVKINNVRVASKQITDGAGAYSLVYTWAMTFPAMKTTTYTVEYPFTVAIRAIDDELSEEDSGGGSEMSRTFTYITHTGAYWAKPIMKATFEYCSSRMIKLIMQAPSGETSTEEKTKYDDKIHVSTETYQWSVKPKPYDINRDKGCVVWTRQEWTPRNPEDDIIVSTGRRSYSYSSEVSTMEKDLRLDELFKKWCAGSGNGGKAKHLGAAEKMTERKLTAENYYAIRQRAFYYPDEKDNPQFENQFSESSSDLGAAYQLKLLKYLRNYIFAVHGHVFKDLQLAECYQNITPTTNAKLSDVEKWNVDWLLDYEKQLKN